MQNRGFTLIEFIIYMAIVSAILVLTSIYILDIIESDSFSNAHRNVQQNGRTALRIINQSIKNSTAFLIAHQGIILTMEDSAENPTTIQLRNGAIEMQKGSDTNVALTDSDVIVSSLYFTDLSYADTPGTVKINFTIEYNNRSGRAIYDVLQNFQSCMGAGS